MVGTDAKKITTVSTKAQKIFSLYSAVFFQLAFNELEVFFQPAFMIEVFVDSDSKWIMRFSFGETYNNFVPMIVSFNNAIIIREVLFTWFKAFSASW